MSPRLVTMGGVAVDGVEVAAIGVTIGEGFSGVIHTIPNSHMRKK
jgi:hypothetical protein